MHEDYLRYLTIYNRENRIALSLILIRHIQGFEEAFRTRNPTYTSQYEFVRKGGF